MIDPALEKLITIPQAGTLIRKLTGTGPTDETIRRYTKSGRRGVILETISRAGKTYISSNAVQKFIWESCL